MLARRIAAGGGAMRLLLTGANGQVGSELAGSLPALGNVVALDHQQCDLLRPELLAGLIRSVNPDVIINAAAYTAVNEAEDEHQRAMKVNGAAVAALAQEAKQAGVLLVHFSSDYVFDGSKEGPYTEDDPPYPLNIYGHSKLAGENAVRQAGGAFLILRTGWVYSATRGRNVLRTILRVLRERDELRIVARHIGNPTSKRERGDLDRILAQLHEREELQIDDDRVGAPTSAAEIAEATAAVIEAAWRESRQKRFASGLYHLTASGATTWHGFAKAVLESATRHGLASPGDAPLLIPVSSDDGRAMLPKHSRLSGDRLRRRYGIALPHWREGLALCLEEELLACEPA
jgi:dTDP-4-dehydrorhamnose reductase